MSESVPTSITSFAHRKTRADSTATTYTYLQESEDGIQESDEQAIIDDETDDVYTNDDIDLEAGSHEPIQRTSSAYSRSSVHDRLLRSDSARTEASGSGHGGRTNQKIYILTEDLTIVVAGFKSSNLGLILYGILCVLSLGVAYLLLRWLPRWQVRIIGRSCPLRDCDWVVIEVSCRITFIYIEGTNASRTNGGSSLSKMLKANSMGDRFRPFLDLPKRSTLRIMMKMTIL